MGFEKEEDQLSQESIERKSLSVKRRLLLGFGVLIALLILSGIVSLWQINRIDTALMQIVNVEEPLQEAVLEMEIHAGETARAILHHIHEPNHRFRDHAHQSENAFQAYSQQFEELVENDEERRLGQIVFHTYSEFKALGDELIDVSVERKASLHRLRTAVTHIDKVLASISKRLTDGEPQDEMKKLAATLRMAIEIEKAFAVVEAYTAMRNPEMKEELRLTIAHFQQQAWQYRQAGLSAAEHETIEQLEQQFVSSVTAARETMALTDQLDSLSNRFEADLVEMDSVLDDDIQPIIHAETVRAAEVAMNSSRRAIVLLACLSVLGVLAGGFLGWHISRSITKPVNELVRGTTIIGKGNREHRIKVDSRDELGVLATAFNGMVDNLNRSSDDLLKSQQEAEKLKLMAAQQEIEQHAADARTDQLTQLHNRRAFDDMMAHHAEECATTGESLTMILFDVDRFKKFNDDHGHQAGDEVLQGVASALASVFQPPEYAARFGGEEFAAILPHCTLAEAALKAEEARKAIEQTAFDIGGLQLQVTASGGVARLATGGNIETIIRQADEALYASKGAGRNCIHLHDGSNITAVGKLVSTEKVAPSC